MGKKWTALEWSRERNGTCTRAAGSRFPCALTHRGVPQVSQYSHCFCLTQLLSKHSHSDSKLLIMFLTPSEVQPSSPPFPAALQIWPLVLRAPHTTSPWLHKSASEPRETSELSGCNNTWWEPGFCCIIPPRDWAGWRKGQGWGSRALLIPGAERDSALSPNPALAAFAARGLGNVLWVGSVIWDLGGGDCGVWKGSIEWFGHAWSSFTSLGLICLSFGWFVSPGFPSHSKATSVCLLL